MKTKYSFKTYWKELSKSDKWTWRITLLLFIFAVILFNPPNFSDGLEFLGFVFLIGSSVYMGACSQHLNEWQKQKKASESDGTATK